MLCVRYIVRYSCRAGRLSRLSRRISCLYPLQHAEALAVQGKASEAYDSAAGAAHEATRGPTTYEKVKDRFTPSTADKAKAKTNSAYGTAKVSGPAVGALTCSPWRLAHGEAAWPATHAVCLLHEAASAAVWHSQNCVVEGTICSCTLNPA